MKQMLVREPSRQITDGIVTYISRGSRSTSHAPTSSGKDYVETIISAGWQTILVPSSASCADGVFIEDPVVVYKDIAILTRPATRHVVSRWSGY